MDGPGDDRIAEWAAAGLVDPDAPGAGERLELLAWLSDLGISVAQMAEADRDGSLSGLVGDLALRPGRRFDIAEAASRAALPQEWIRELMRGIGIRPVGPDEAVFTDDDVKAFRLFEEAARLFGRPHVLQFTRTMARALSRVADAAVSLFLTSIEAPLRDQPRYEPAVARANLEAVEVAVGVLGPVLDNVFRLLLEDAIRRSRGARRPGGSLQTGRLAVGFVDLVGFTSLTLELSADELSDVVEAFEAHAVAVAADHDGQVVKFIGDEVMFVAPDAVAGCRIALDLVDRFRRPGPGLEPAGGGGEGGPDPAGTAGSAPVGARGVTPRGCVASGELLIRGGDYYGVTVNLASRAADLAVPCEVLVTADVRDEVDAGAADLCVEGAGRRVLRGFDEPVAFWSVTRSRPTP